MKLKKFMFAFTVSVFSIMLSVNVSAENTIDKSKFGDVLVSFLYFAGVLALIYLILFLVNKWGKKHQNENKDNSTKDNEITADTESAENKADVTDIDDNSDKGEKEE